ncbi:hypothetical protein BG22_06150 [Bifidobacterium sp. UTBIF-78]|nr:hypothetical protein BG22_06150 [Bifidobacterium sp. UTBIF-78]
MRYLPALGGRVIVAIRLHIGAISPRTSVYIHYLTATDTTGECIYAIFDDVFIVCGQLREHFVFGCGGACAFCLAVVDWL